MSAKIRKSFLIEQEKAKLLRKAAKALGISESDFVRRALDNFFETETQQGQRWKREDLYEERLSRINRRLSDKG